MADETKNGRDLYNEVKDAKAPKKHFILKTKGTFGGKAGHAKSIAEMNAPLKEAIEAFWEKYDWEHLKTCTPTHARKFVEEDNPQLIEEATFWKPVGNPYEVNEENWEDKVFEVLDKKILLGKQKNILSPMQSVLNKMKKDKRQSNASTTTTDNNTGTESTTTNGSASGTDRGISPPYVMKKIMAEFDKPFHSSSNASTTTIPNGGASPQYNPTNEVFGVTPEATRLNPMEKNNSNSTVGKRSYNKIAQDDTHGPYYIPTPDPNNLLHFHEIRVKIESVYPYLLFDVRVEMEFDRVFVLSNKLYKDPTKLYKDPTNYVGSLYFEKKSHKDGLTTMANAKASEDCDFVMKRRDGKWRTFFTMGVKGSKKRFKEELDKRDIVVQAGGKCKFRLTDSGAAYGRGDFRAYDVAEMTFDKDNQHPIKTSVCKNKYIVEITYSLKEVKQVELERWKWTFLREDKVHKEFEFLL